MNEDSAQDLDEAPPPVYCVVHDGQVSFVSSTSVEVSGIAPERFHGRHVLELVHPDDASAIRPFLEAGWSGIFEQRIRLQDADGRWSWRLVHGMRTINESGHASAVMTLRRIVAPTAH